MVLKPLPLKYKKKVPMKKLFNDNNQLSTTKKTTKIDEQLAAIVEMGQVSILTLGAYFGSVAERYQPTLRWDH